MKLMGASMALAGVGLAGCRRPEGYLVPFNKGVEWTIPGKFLYYATAMPIRQGAMPLVVSTVDGRPTKIEGNPLHPYSNGGTDGFHPGQCAGSLRSASRQGHQGKRCGKVDAADLREIPEGMLPDSVARDWPSSVERKNSPTRDRLRAELEAKYPGLDLGRIRAARRRRDGQGHRDCFSARASAWFPNSSAPMSFWRWIANFSAAATRASASPPGSSRAAIRTKRARR